MIIVAHPIAVEVHASPHSTMYTARTMTREEYELDLKRRQEEHLASVRRNRESRWQPCMHDSCPECLGTGVRRDGGVCIHGISCPCPKCSPGSF